MNVILLKVIVVVVAIILAGAIWLGLILVLKSSSVSFLQTLAVYISQLSIFGWLLFLLLILAIYKLAVRNLIPLSSR